MNDTRPRSSGGARLTDELVGYDVEGTDGRVGRVERVTRDGGWAVVAVGPLHARTYAVPASSVRLVDPESEAILVDVAREELERSPRLGSSATLRDDPEDAIRAYYASLRAGRSR